jgi:hypothetical protein
MKYALAIFSHMMKVYGNNQCIGYDIMCAFMKTLLRSSLGKKVVALKIRGVVPAFHGHAHTRKCQVSNGIASKWYNNKYSQVRWHPQYMQGVGLEDFETCERTFSASNALARATRLSTQFHRRQEILEHFMFQDQDKFRMTGKLRVYMFLSSV